MTKDEMQQIRDALENWHESETASGSVIDYTDELDILDAELAAPEPRIARTLSTQEIYKLWRERSTWNIPAFVRRCFKAAQS